MSLDINTEFPAALSLSVGKDYNRSYGKDNPFAGTEYADLWSNNPYATLYYEPNFWDYIGLSNKSKDANAEYDRLYSEYIAGIYDLKQKNEYNSPANQANLERQAGLNPDLTGVSGVGESPGMNPPNAGMNPALNVVSPAHQVLSTVTQVLGFATSTMQQIQTIKGLGFDNLSKSLGSFDKFTELARPHIIQEYSNRFSGGTPENWSNVAGVSAQSLGLSRRQTKRYKQAFTSLLSSSQFTSSEAAYKNLTANDKAMYDYIGKMAELSYLAQKHKYQGDISKAVYDKVFFDNLDGKTAAESQNRINSNAGWLDKWRNEYYNMLYSDFKNGSYLAGLILIGSGIPQAGISALGNFAGDITKLFGRFNSKSKKSM